MAGVRWATGRPARVPRSGVRSLGCDARLGSPGRRGKLGSRTQAGHAPTSDAGGRRAARRRRRSHSARPTPPVSARTPFDRRPPLPKPQTGLAGDSAPEHRPLFHVLEDADLIPLATVDDPTLEPALRRIVADGEAAFAAAARVNDSGEGLAPRSQNVELRFATETYAINSARDLKLDPKVARVLDSTKATIDRARTGNTESCGLATVEITRTTVEVRPRALTGTVPLGSRKRSRSSGQRAPSSLVSVLPISSRAPPTVWPTSCRHGACVSQGRSDSYVRSRL